MTDTNWHSVAQAGTLEHWNTGTLEPERQSHGRCDPALVAEAVKLSAHWRDPDHAATRTSR